MCCFDKGNIEGIYSSKFVSDACVCCFMFFQGWFCGLTRKSLYMTRVLKCAFAYG